MLTHPDRLYWPEDSITKQLLAEYYADLWPRIAPFITDRPLALVRGPEGIAGPRFFQKNLWKGAPAHILALRDPADGADSHLIGIRSVEGLVDLAQSATLEIHPWGSTCRDWERPDMLVMDLDPGDGVAWPQVVAAAREVRARLEHHGLAAFVKATGGKGLHVVAPLIPSAEWPSVEIFTRAMARAMAADSPDRYVATVAKALRHDHILVDYLRNHRGATAVAPYSPRARPGAPVAVPLAWDELGPDREAVRFTLKTIRARLAAQKIDPWQDFRGMARMLEAARH